MAESITCPDCHRDPCQCEDLRRGYRLSPGGIKEPVYRTPRPNPALRDPALPALKAPDGTVVPLAAPCEHRHLVCADCGQVVGQLVPVAMPAADTGQRPPLIEHGRTDDVHPANLRPSKNSET